MGLMDIQEPFDCRNHQAIKNRNRELNRAADDKDFHHAPRPTWPHQETRGKPSLGWHARPYARSGRQVLFH